MIYLLTAIGLTPGGSSTVHIYTQNNTWNNTINNKNNTINNLIVIQNNSVNRIYRTEHT